MARADHVLVLRALRGLAGDLRGKFRSTWSGPYIIRELTQEGAAWLTDLDGNQFLEMTNVDQLKSIMFETMVVGWEAIILVSHIPFAPTLISRPLIAH